MTQKWLWGVGPKVTQKWLRMPEKNHFSAAIFESLWDRPLKVTFESLFRHFNCFWFSGLLGGHAPHNTKPRFTPKSGRNTSDFFEDRYDRTPKGGAKKRGGQNLMRRPPTENGFRRPSPQYVLPPPMPFLLVSPLEIPRISRSWPPQKPFSEGLEKWFSTGHLREVLLFGTFCPPFSSAQPVWLDDRDCTMEIYGGTMASYLARTPRVLLFMLTLIGLEARRFRLPQATREHFRCTVNLRPVIFSADFKINCICLMWYKRTRVENEEMWKQNEETQKS